MLPWNSSHFSLRGSVNYPPHSLSHISHEKWSPATFSLVTGVVLFVLNILLLLLLPSHSEKKMQMLSIKMSANFHHVFTKACQVTRQWNADYKVIRTPNIYCLLKMLSLTVRVCSFVACKTVVLLHLNISLVFDISPKCPYT